MFSLRMFMSFLLASLIFIAFTTKTFWIQWTFLAFIVLVVFIVIELFLEEESFANSPNYDHWKNLKESRLIEFESDSSSKDKKKLF